MTNKALVVSCNSPPRQSATNRVRAIINYLSEFDWSPTILTREIDNQSDKKIPECIEQTYYPGDLSKIIKENVFFAENDSENNQSVVASNSRIKQVKNAFSDYIKSTVSDIILYPDDEKLWKKHALERAVKLFEIHDFDAIISTSPPVTNHIISFKLARKYNKPWIVDFKDLWTQNHYYDHNSIRSYFETRLEKRIIQNASILTAATDPMAQCLQKSHKKEAKGIYTGFDPESTEQLEPTDEFSIVYTGNLYQGKRDPSMLLDAIKNLDSNSQIDIENVKIYFIGDNGEWLDELVSERDLDTTVSQPGLLPRSEVLTFQKQAQLLLSIQWGHPMEKIICPGKMFEYLAAQRPILSYGGSEEGGVVNSILNQTKAGVKLSSKNKIKKFLYNSYNQYEKDGQVKYHGLENKIDKFSQRESAKEFSNILDYVSN